MDSTNGVSSSTLGVESDFRASAQDSRGRGHRHVHRILQSRQQSRIEHFHRRPADDDALPAALPRQPGRRLHHHVSGAGEAVQRPTDDPSPSNSISTSLGMNALNGSKWGLELDIGVTKPILTFAESAMVSSFEEVIFLVSCPANSCDKLRRIFCCRQGAMTCRGGFKPARVAGTTRGRATQPTAKKTSKLLQEFAGHHTKMNARRSNCRR